MSQKYCPNCRAPLIPLEIEEGQCTACMKPLPADWGGHVATEPQPRRGSLQVGEGTSWGERDTGYESPRMPSLSLQKPADWSAFKLGVTMVFWAQLILLILSFLDIPLRFVGGLPGRGLGAGPGFGAMAVLIMIPLTCARLITSLVWLVGTFVCCAIPSEARASGWVQSLIICSILLVLLVIGMFAAAFTLTAQQRFGPGTPPPPEWLPFVLLFAVVALLLLFLCHLSFIQILRAGARFWGDDGLAHNLMTYFILMYLIPVVMGVALFVLVGFSIGANAKPEGAFLIAGVGYCGLIVTMFGLFIWYLTMLHRLRTLIR